MSILEVDLKTNKDNASIFQIMKGAIVSPVPRKSWSLAIVGIISLGLIIGAVSFTTTSCRAVLISPRLGAPVRTAPVQGSSLSTGNQGFIPGETSLWIGTDPAENPIPTGWLSASKWRVVIAFSGLDNCPLVECEVKRVTGASNPFVVLGGGDSAVVRVNALRVDFVIPANIEPGLYSIHVTFQKEFTQDSAQIEAGDFLGVRGSGNLLGSAFELAEANCLYVPWIRDGLASDSEATLATKLGTFSLIHITDIHTNLLADEDGTWVNQPLMDNLAQAISIWAPDVVIATGDITDGPGDVPEEYQRAYNWIRALGVPVIMSNGNHDQGDLGLWAQFFGPQTSVIDWGNISLISFNSNLPLNAETLELIIHGIQDASDQREACFVVCHAPLMDYFGRATQGSAGAIVDALVQFNATGSLTGHNHYNLVMDAPAALKCYLQLGNFGTAVEIPSRVGTVVPAVRGPKLIITTSGGKGARDRPQEFWPDYKVYEGYRRITLADNRMVNYTYDLNDDGKRDPSYSQPLYQLNRSLSVDPGIGSTSGAGAHLLITNNLTESISAARAAFQVPAAPAGYTWTATGASNLVLRAHYSNGTHEFFDYRLPVAARSSVTVNLVPSII